MNTDRPTTMLPEEHHQFVREHAKAMEKHAERTNHLLKALLTIFETQHKEQAKK